MESSNDGILSGCIQRFGCQNICPYIMAIDCFVDSLDDVEVVELLTESGCSHLCGVKVVLISWDSDDHNRCGEWFEEILLSKS